MKNEKQYAISIHLDSELKQKLELLCKKHTRSKANLIRYLINNAYEKDCQETKS